MSEPIDFVICWVDGNDPKWQRDKNRYTPDKKTDSRNIRYRDFENLHYWFRSVEKFAPWVRKIHLVTWGHLPDWLNKKHPKLNIVNHEDYIPNEYLPTFSARPIEVNLHRIEDLAEQFVYFNDDTFLLKSVDEKDFFKNNKPCDVGVIDIGIKSEEHHGSSVYNSLVIINKYFNKSETIKSDLFKWFNPIYGKLLLRTLLLMPWKSFTGFYTPHIPNSFLKETFKEVWEKEYETLDFTSRNKFRNKLDVTQYLFKFWQLASGNFEPRRNLGRKYSLGSQLNQAKSAVEKQKHKMICLNDDDVIGDFEKTKQSINNSLYKVHPKRSEFEILK